MALMRVLATVWLRVKGLPVNGGSNGSFGYCVVKGEGSPCSCLVGVYIDQDLITI